MITRTPLTTLISLEHALVTEPFASLSDELPQLSNTNLKALFLAHERKRGREESEHGGRGRGEERKGLEDKEMEGERGTIGGMGTEAGSGGGRERERSFWHPYLDSLPRILHTTLFFSEEELQYLQSSMVTSPHYQYKQMISQPLQLREFAEKQQSSARKVV